jgi:tetratricopeptide (TPR) repeat protein
MARGVGRVLIDGLDKGAGFVLTPSVVITAHHVVSERGAKTVSFALSDGGSIPVSQVDEDEALDIAKLALSQESPDMIAAIGKANEDDRWRVEAQPHGDDPMLKGTVDSTKWQLHNAKGRITEVLQLQVEESLGDYAGYSGSPVVLNSPPLAVIGVLVQQQLLRTRWSSETSHRPASNVLYAIPIDSVLRRFNLERLARSALKVPADQPKRRRRATDIKIAGDRPFNPGEAMCDRQEECRQLRDWVTAGFRLITVVGRPGSGKTALVAYVLSEFEQQGRRTADNGAVTGIIYLTGSGDRISIKVIGHYLSSLLVGQRQTYLTAVLNNPQSRAQEQVEQILKPLRQLKFVVLLEDVDAYINEDGSFHNQELDLFIRHFLTGPQRSVLIVTSSRPVAWPTPGIEKRILLDKSLPVDDAISLLRLQDPDPHGIIAQIGESQLRDAVTELFPAHVILLGKALQDPMRSVNEIIRDIRDVKDRGIRPLFDAAFRQLTPTERHVMQALSVLGRPETAAAVSAMLPYIRNLRAPLQGLQQALLVHKTVDNLLSIAQMDRQYFYGRLSRDGEYGQLEMHQRAANYYMSRQVGRQSWKEPKDLLAHVREFEHRVAAEEFDNAADVLAHAQDYLIWTGWAREVLEMLDRLDGKITNPRALALYNIGRAQCQMLLGPLMNALEPLDQARDLALKLKDREIMCTVRILMAETYRRAGKFTNAIDHLEWAIAECPLDLCIERAAHVILGLVYVYAGEYSKAEEVGRSLQHLAIRCKHEELTAHSEDVFSLASLRSGHPDEAAQHAEKGYDIYMRIGDYDAAGYMLNTLGMCYMATKGQEDKALDTFTRGQKLCSQWSNKRGEALCLCNRALLYARRVELDASVSDAEKAARIFDTLESLEAPAARSFLQWLRALRAGDKAKAATALGQYMEASAHAGDLFLSGDLRHLARRLESKKHGSDSRRS